MHRIVANEGQKKESPIECQSIQTENTEKLIRVDPCHVTWKYFSDRHVGDIQSYAKLPDSGNLEIKKHLREVFSDENRLFAMYIARLTKKTVAIKNEIIAAAEILISALCSAYLTYLKENDFSLPERVHNRVFQNIDDFLNHCIDSGYEKKLEEYAVLPPEIAMHLTKEAFEKKIEETAIKSLLSTYNTEAKNLKTHAEEFTAAITRYKEFFQKINKFNAKHEEEKITYQDIFARIEIMLESYRQEKKFPFTEKDIAKLAKAWHQENQKTFRRSKSIGDISEKYITTSNDITSKNQGKKGIKRLPSFHHFSSKSKEKQQEYIQKHIHENPLWRFSSSKVQLGEQDVHKNRNVETQQTGCKKEENIFNFTKT